MHRDNGPVHPLSTQAGAQYTTNHTGGGVSLPGAWLPKPLQLAGGHTRPLVHAPHALLPWGLPATSGFAIRTATTYHYRKCSVWPDPHIIATSVLVIIATLQIMGVRVVLPLTPHCSGVCLPFPTQGPSTT